jgi:hypothetical protein
MMMQMWVHKVLYRMPLPRSTSQGREHRGGWRAAILWRNACVYPLSEGDSPMGPMQVTASALHFSTRTIVRVENGDADVLCLPRRTGACVPTRREWSFAPSQSGGLDMGGRRAQEIAVGRKTVEGQVL